MMAARNVSVFIMQNPDLPRVLESCLESLYDLRHIPQLRTVGSSGKSRLSSCAKTSKPGSHFAQATLPKSEGPA